MDINAVRVGEKWLPFRQGGARLFFSVHSVFNRVVNVSTDRELLSVTASNVGGSSSFLSLAGSKVDFGVAAGERCILCEGRMSIANHTINFMETPPWKGPITKNYRHKVRKENISAFKAVLDRKAAPGSAWRIVNGASESRFGGLGAIRRLREDPSLAEKLIGLGLGLTPAGDDMLVGYLAMANHTYEDTGFTDILHGVVSDSLGKTVDISAQILKNALDCDYHGYVQGCIRDLCEGGQEDIYISTASLLNIGATSGSDIACGMYFGMFAA